VLYIYAQGSYRIQNSHAGCGIVATIAGDGSAGYGGDGGFAATAQLNNPQGVAVDGAGNLYIADYFNMRIRKVTPSGIITTIAGNGESGYSGDGFPATMAQIGSPQNIACDAHGNIYISDVFNGRIRLVDTNGFMHTFAGNGTWGNSGDGGPATNAEFQLPTAIAVDKKGNVYFSDEGNGNIRKINTHGIITTIAGTGMSGYSGDGGPATNAEIDVPWGISVDGIGNVYVPMIHYNTIRMIDTAGIIWTIIGTGVAGYSGDSGPASAAELNFPAGIYATDSGYVYFSDMNNNRIRKVDPHRIITTVAGNGMAGYSGDGGFPTAAEFNNPPELAVGDNNILYIADANNQRIRTVGDCVGISDPTATSSTNCSIYPNPGSSEFVLLFNSNQNSQVEPLELLLTDCFGRTIFAKNIAAVGNQLQIPLSLPGLDAGLYYLHIWSSGRFVSTKLVVEK